MLPEGWSKQSVSEVCQSVSVGVVIKPSQYYVSANQGVKAFRSANVREGQVNNSDWVYFSHAGNNENKKSELKAGDVLVVRTGYPGTACVVSPEYAGCNAIDIVIARPDVTKIIPAYLCVFTNSEYGKSQIANLQGGMAQKHLNVGAYQQVEIPLPPLPEQKKIEAILSTWDRAIERTEKLLANSQQQKKALMQQLLTGKKRLPGFTGEWDIKRINEIANRIKRTSDGKKYPILMISSSIGFVTQDTKYSRYMAGESVKKYILLAEGEFAYNKGNSKIYQFGCVFQLYEYKQGLVPNVYVCFKIKQEQCSEFYQQLFKFDFLKPQLRAIVNSGIRNNGLLNIKPEQFMNTWVPAPPLPEQKAIAAILTTADEEIAAIESDLSRLRDEKKALMQQLLTGKRRVKVDQEISDTGL